MQTEHAQELGNILNFARKIVTVLEGCAEAIIELDRMKEISVAPSRLNSFEDFIRFARGVGKWEIAAMLERCECVRWKPEIPRFKFKAPRWEATTLGMLYNEDLRGLLTKYCDGKEPKYLVFEAHDET